MIFQINFYVPEIHLETVKQALFDQGAGRFGNYEHCCWQTKGLGQFKPLQGSTPYIGVYKKLEQLTEFKVEMICQEQYLTQVITTLLKVHPYETPAYQIYQIYMLDDLPFEAQ